MSDIKYIESPWSIKEKIKLTAEELELLSKKTSNNNTKRGNELERSVFDKFLQHLEGFQEIENYCKQMSKRYQNFTAIATIDFLIHQGGKQYIVEQYIVEIKTKTATLDKYGNLDRQKVIVLRQVATRDKEHDMSAELDIQGMSIDCAEDKELIVAVETVLKKYKYFDGYFDF